MMKRPADLNGAGTIRSWPDHACTLRYFTALFLVAVPLNYVWELAQSRFFVEIDNGESVWWHCFIASLGDGVLVWAIYIAGWSTFRRQDWFERPGPRGYILMFVAGLTIAVAVELIAVHVLQSWSYVPAMPRLPVLDIGIVPIVQMLVLPPLIFRIVAASISRGVFRVAKNSWE